MIGGTGPNTSSTGLYQGGTLLVPGFIVDVTWDGNGSDPSGNIVTTGQTLLLMAIALYTGSSGAPVTVPTPSDNKGNVWHLVASVNPASAGGTNIALFLFASTTGNGGSGHNFSAGAVASTYQGCIVAAFNNTATSLADQTNTNSGGNGVLTFQSGQVTPTQNGELVVAVMGNLYTSAPISATINESFSSPITLPAIYGTDVGCSLSYKVTSLAVNPTWSFSSDANQGDVMGINATFKAAA